MLFKLVWSFVKIAGFQKTQPKPIVPVVKSKPRFEDEMADEELDLIVGGSIPWANWYVGSKAAQREEQLVAAR